MAEDLFGVTMTREEWTAVITVMRGARVDGYVWDRPGEFIASALLMAKDPSLLERFQIGNDFLDRMSGLSPSEGWAVVHLCEAYWDRRDTATSVDEFLSGHGLC